MIRVVCDCGKSYQAPEERGGQTVRCPSCRGMITIPRAVYRLAGNPSAEHRTVDADPCDSLPDADEFAPSHRHKHTGGAEPFFNKLFAAESSVWKKILGGAVVVPFLVGPELDITVSSWIDFGVIIFLGAAGGMFIGALLGMRDTVLVRLRRGQRVSALLRLLFANSLVSAVIWCFIIGTVTMLITFGLSAWHLSAWE